MLSEPQPRPSASPSLTSESRPATVRYAIIGAGMMGREHMRNIGLLDGAEIVAIADPNAESRAGVSQAGFAGVQFPDHRELLSAGGFDCVVIASPNDTHAAILRDVLVAGKPVLVEKPLCATVEDCHDILRIAETAKAPAWVAMEYRYMPPVERLISRLQAGDAGRLRMIAIREHRYPFLDKVDDWNRFAVRTGGTLVEKCCHFFDLMRLMAGGEAVRVYASGAMDVNFVGESYDGRAADILDNAFVVVDFDNGVRAMLDLCMFAEGSYWQEQIAATGDLARVEAFVPGPARFSPDGRERLSEIVFSPRASKVPVREEIHVDADILAAGDHHGSTFFQHRKFLDMVRNGGNPEVSLEDGMRAVMIGAAAEESARTGRAVEL
ncbi:Gfo/Idh/MocA family oxidoreductase [Nitratireductor mangrovi]|uniref:Gfo/Idh/MocA family oxidoreductase n=1 Tax=Nitratireductor mangrovi TaxID=2599600 RepID=A0A5B8L4H1_9HYPH|nr:Gfo/Idh/MocA family oxidoreductase [Nitratireductor mangrovi]